MYPAFTTINVDEYRDKPIKFFCQWRASGEPKMSLAQELKYLLRDTSKLACDLISHKCY